MVLILPILVLDLEAILCRSDFRIGLVAVLVSRIALDAICGLARIGAIFLRIFDFGRDTICLHIRTGFCPVGRVALLRIGFAALFRMGELALRDHTALFHLSVMSDTVCGNRSSASMNRTIRVRIGVFHGNLVRLELALDFEILLHGHLIFECGLAGDTERAADRGILEISLIRNSQLTIYLCTFQRGIACDRERLIHGHVALELRSIFHSQRACVHSARRGDSAIASIYAFTFQLAFRSHIAFRLHIAKVIDSHIAFDRSFVCSVNAVDSGGALLDGSDIVLIVLNVICISLDLASELDILRFEVSDIRCHFAIQRSDFPFQCCIRNITILNFLVDLLIQLVVSFFARKSFRLYFCRSRDRSPREALAVDLTGFYVRKPGNRTIAITHNVSIFYSNTINASSSPISIRNIGGLLLQIFNSRILFTSCCF